MNSRKKTQQFEFFYLCFGIFMTAVILISGFVWLVFSIQKNPFDVSQECFRYLEDGFYYKIKFDSSSLRIQSRRTISSIFGSKSYNLEISNDMLIGFRFFRDFFSINDKLLIQMRSSSGRKSAIRIPMTLLGKKRKVKLTKILNNIIQNN